MAGLAMLADLTGSGCLINHKVVTHPASIPAQDREGSPAETSILPTGTGLILNWHRPRTPLNPGSSASDQFVPHSKVGYW